MKIPTVGPFRYAGTNVFICLKHLTHLITPSFLDKLNNYGIRGVANNLFCSYISNRYQYLDFNGSISSIKIVDTEVPKGSIF